MIFGHIVHCHGGYYSTSSCIDCIVDFVDMNDADDVVIGILARRNKNTVTSLEAWLIFKKEILNISTRRRLSKERAVESACESHFLLGRNNTSAACAVWKIYFDYFWDITLSPDLPFQVHNDALRGGLRIIGKGDTDVEALLIMGFLFAVNVEEYSSLVSARYFSIFQGSGEKRGILYGPLALMNHCCVADWFFPNPRKWKNRYDRLEIEILIWTKLKSHKFEVTIGNEEELFVNYFPGGEKPTWFKCKCPKCFL